MVPSLKEWSIIWKSDHLSWMLSRECIRDGANCKLGRLSRLLEQCDAPGVLTVVENGIGKRFLAGHVMHYMWWWWRKLSKLCEVLYPALWRKVNLLTQGGIILKRLHTLWFQLYTFLEKAEQWSPGEQHRFLVVHMWARRKWSNIFNLLKENNNNKNPRFLYLAKYILKIKLK